MTEGYVLSLAQGALMTALLLAAPVMFASLIVGSLISLFQAATQINEATLTFIPKVLVGGAILAILGSWMGQQMLAFTTTLFNSLATLPR
jgi:flagellar biosynthetic protein FliQ